MKTKSFIIPQYITAKEIRDFRKSLGLSQKEFADLMGCSKPTVVRWESSKENITGPIVCAVFAIKNNDKLKTNLVLSEMKFNLRLKYMYRQQICTVIDIDEMNEKVEIINYEDNVMFRAFGANENPNYADFEVFLESRCFPRTRDKMKLILEDLNLPFYNPLMIIEKTQGRMAEDDFWIDVERK